jgi:hypothetical protein
MCCYEIVGTRIAKFGVTDKEYDLCKIYEI